MEVFDEDIFESSDDESSLADKDMPMQYGLYPGTQRWACDQVPLEVALKEYTLNHKSSGECCIRGAKYDMGNRIATLQLFARAEGEQTMKPIIIFEKKRRKLEKKRKKSKKKKEKEAKSKKKKR